MLTVPRPDFHALVTGETVVASVARSAVSEGDELHLQAGDARPPLELKPAYRAWADMEPAPGSWSAVVAAVHPAQAFDEGAGSRHILMTHLEGDIVVLRVYGGAGAVLSDVAFDARVRSLEGSLRP